MSGIEQAKPHQNSRLRNPNRRAVRAIVASVRTPSLGLVEIVVPRQVEQAVGAHARQQRRPARADARADCGAGRGMRKGHHPRGVYRPSAATMRPACSSRFPTNCRPRSGDLRSRGALSEEDIDRAMREIRLALLEADVNFRVVKTFVAAVRERSVGQEVSRA